MKNLFTKLWVKVGLILMALPPALAHAEGGGGLIPEDSDRLVRISGQQGFEQGAKSFMNLSPFL